MSDRFPFLFLLYLLTCYPVGSFASPVEERLFTDLLDTYNKKARPVTDDGQVVVVTLDLALPKLMKVDEKNEVMVTNVWIKEYWHDPRLVWNRTQYEGISKLMIRAEELWLPDIILLNNAEGASGGTSAANVAVSHTGDVARLIPTILTSSCAIDITYFPLDDQVCELLFSSWSYSRKFLDLQMKRNHADLSEYAENGEWILLGANATRTLSTYDCCEGEYPDVTYKIRLRRRTVFYMMNFILPCTLIAVLTILVFVLPPESGERMSFGVTVMLSFTILILMLMAKLPASSKVIPMIGVYYACTIFEVSAAIGMACMVLRFYHPENTTAPVPKWVKIVILDFGAKLLRLNKSAERVRQAVMVQEWRQEKFRENKRKEQTNMNILTEAIFKKEEAEAKQEEWRMAAIIINRVCVWVYMIIILITAGGVLLVVPQAKSGSL